MRSRLTVALALAVTAMLTAAPFCMAQNDDQPVKDAIDALLKAVNDGDAEAFAGMLSDSGFVGLLPTGGGVELMDKEQIVAGLGTNPPPGPITIEDVKVSMHWMVAMASGTIGGPEAGAETFRLDLMLMREAGEWKVVALWVGPEGEEADEETVKAIEESIGSLPQTMEEGDVEIIGQAIHDEHFVLAYVDPAFEVRWCNSKAMLLQLIQSVLPMITINSSSYEAHNTLVSGNMAVADGAWVLDITDLGETRSDMRIYAVKTDEGWKIVAMAGGPEA